MDGYCRKFLNSSIIQSLLLQEGREKMGNSMKRRKEKKKNERFDEILADSVEDVVLMRRSEDWACCSKKETKRATRFPSHLLEPARNKKRQKPGQQL